MIAPNLAAALRHASARIPPEQIDVLWIFPPRALGDRESGLAVLSVLFGTDEKLSMRRVFTLAYEAERKGGRTRRTDHLTEQGSAPADRVPRLIAGVLRRLGESAEPPRAETIAGDPARWDALVRGGPSLDPANGE